jgi:moderate conductance mechanosensitive channel
MMSSLLNSWFNIAIFPALHLLIILSVALVLNRLWRGFTTGLVKPPAAPTRAAQAHEQQARGVADAVYHVGSKLVWLVALLAALPEFGVAAWPGVALGGLAILAVGLGAQNTVRDLIAGCHIVLEDQYAVGDTVRIVDVAGRVEQLTLRRTVVRDSRGAMVTVANGEIRHAANLSRDYSQAFVDIAVAVEESMDRTQQALEAASAGLRADPAWTQVLIDGPRVLGIQEYGPAACTLRLQLRTAPMRQEEVCRELRRRVQLEFQRHGIALANFHGMDAGSAFHALDDIEKPESAS